MDCQVYRLRSDPEQYRWLDIADGGSFLRLNIVRSGDPVAATWVPIRVERLTATSSDSMLPLGDFPTFGAVPVFSERAARALVDLLAPHGELLPLEGEPFLVFNVTTVLDALDEERSDLQRFTSGRVMQVNRFVLRPDRLDGSPIFKLSAMPRVDVFVSERFRHRVAESGLVGFVFEPIWPVGGPSAAT